MTDNQQPGEPVAWEAKYTAALRMISDLNEGRREWLMSIPARPKYDPDLVIADALHAMRGALLPHPRPRVGVTEAAKSLLDAYNNQLSDGEKDAAWVALARALADSPAPLANGGGEVARG